MPVHRSTFCLLAIGLAAAPVSRAVEGMWTPDQMPALEEDLQRQGLRMDPEALSDLGGFPLGAVVSLGGCSASFVSPDGLVITNHHCARGSVQYNSSEERNYLADGFVARSLAEELPAAPGSRVYVTESVVDVTDQVRGELADELSGRERYQAIEDRTKSLVAECEKQGGRRCSVRSFHGGLSYKLITHLEISDVRLVYAPGDSIGRFGGDVDNFMWPRHTGDFAFYRAYVGPDGEPADRGPANVPFQPPHHLRVSAAGLEAGDFVMVAGYPGSTSRYRRGSEVEQVFGWTYPEAVRIYKEWIATIEDAAPAGTEARIKYESRLAGLNNAMKNRAGQIAGARRAGLNERRAERDRALDAWLVTEPSRKVYLPAIEALDAVLQEEALAERRDFAYDNATSAQLLGIAWRLYRLAREGEKPDAERTPGYQERDLRSLRQRLEAIDRRFDVEVDKAVWLLFLEEYMAQPGPQRVADFDRALGLGEGYDHALGLGEGYDRATVEAILARYYAETELDDAAKRLAWLARDRTDFEASDDPFIRLAVAIYDFEMAREEEQKERAGRLAALRPQYMEAIIAFNEAQGRPIYPDANSTLRITYGTVQGGALRDGVVYEPFTRLEGIVEKATGEAPFDAPARELELIRAEDYGSYELPGLGSVPVNFLSDLDITGGNSGSATLNARGEMVGLVFDGVIESLNSDWHFDARTSRSIHVDSRYMLWVMEKVDGAEHLIEEMEIVGR